MSSLFPLFDPSIGTHHESRQPILPNHAVASWEERMMFQYQGSIIRGKVEPRGSLPCTDQRSGLFLPVIPPELRLTRRASRFPLQLLDWCPLVFHRHCISPVVFLSFAFHCICGFYWCAICSGAASSFDLLTKYPSGSVMFSRSCTYLHRVAVPIRRRHSWEPFPSVLAHHKGTMGASD